MILASTDRIKEPKLMFTIYRENPDRSFPEEYEKILVALVLAIARILGSICHDHPLHDDAAELGEESKKFYKVRRIVMKPIKFR